MQQLAKTRTSTININKVSGKNYKNTGSSKNDFYINKNIKNGSIADYANMMNRDYFESNVNKDDDNLSSDK